MIKRQINIDKQIDNSICPGHFFCVVATTCYELLERERICYRCWLSYCRENDIEIIYD